MTKHTPGPWGLSNNATPDRTPTEWVIGPLTGRQVIARVTTIPQDARLIAAAPELLEQLEKNLFALESAINLRGMVELVPYAESTRHLIAKARGE